ncbi:MAG: HAD family hydrolase [Myxococcales bacterium]|nr:HAD family hydrolase [Myxococcales bacterium]MDH5307154.1 HAD family hydrolase [Myxococcales bacterium]
MSTRAAAFLDRDGTLIEWIHLLTEAARVRLIAGAAQGVRTLQAAGYRCVVVTNQSVIGRGMLSEAGLGKIHAEMARQLAAHGCVLDGLYFCPEAPRQEDPSVLEHPDRKPGPGMLLRAAAELGLDPSRSWMIGDSLADMLAGHNAGCRGSILVRTGKGAAVDAAHPAIDHVARDLADAANWIVSLPAGALGSRNRAVSDS